MAYNLPLNSPLFRFTRVSFLQSAFLEPALDFRKVFSKLGIKIFPCYLSITSIDQ